ncbi:MAG: hypothetical protein K5905_18675, partial [Roseibium sp.]|uniref:hypothetical protein n=1 Tax=Roseibium sp. TaxID=1936156 RepID=UPI00261E074E
MASRSASRTVDVFIAVPAGTSGSSTGSATTGAAGAATAAGALGVSALNDVRQKGVTNHAVFHPLMQEAAFERLRLASLLTGTS